MSDKTDSELCRARNGFDICQLPYGHAPEIPQHHNYDADHDWD